MSNLVDVIRKLESGWPLRRLSELTPHRWAAEQAPSTALSRWAQPERLRLSRAARLLAFDSPLRKRWAISVITASAAVQHVIVLALSHR